MLLPRASSSDPLRRFSAEFRLILCCLRWPYDEQRLASIAETAQSVCDWSRVSGIAARHRVTGLVYTGLLSAAVAIPASVEQHLREETSRHTQLGLRLALESARLARLFSAAGLQPLFLKGAPLTQVLYGNPSLRFAKDIDLLVRPDEVVSAAAVLHAAGYQPVQAGAAGPEMLPLWIGHGKAMDWRATLTGIYLELHWRPTDLPLLRTVDLWRSAGHVQIGSGTPVSTLSGDSLVAYLCVHGASHGWFRLKWLADVFALVPQRDPARVEALHERTRELDCGRAVAQALLLCHDLLGLPIGRVARLADDDAAQGLLHWHNLRLLAGKGEQLELEKQPFGTTRVYASRFLIGSGAASLVSEARTWLVRPEEMADWSLPHSLLFLLPFARLARWMQSRIRYRGRSKS